jgi:hypothetical protein
MFNGGDKVVLTDIYNSKVAKELGKGRCGVVTHRSPSGKVIVVKWEDLVDGHEYHKISWMAHRFTLWEADKYKVGDLCVVSNKYPQEKRRGHVGRLMFKSGVDWAVEWVTTPPGDYNPINGWLEKWLDPFELKPSQRVKFINHKHAPSHYVGKLGTLKQKHLTKDWWLVAVDGCGSWWEEEAHLEPIFYEPAPACEPVNPVDVDVKPKSFWTFNPDTGVVKRDAKKPEKKTLFGFDIGDKVVWCGPVEGKYGLNKGKTGVVIATGAGATISVAWDDHDLNEVWSPWWQPKYFKLVMEEEEIDDCVNPQF